MHVLIADDHQLFIDGMRILLGKLDESVQVTECNNAERAIEILESGASFDLVLIDLSMPGMDGMSILQRMHNRKVWLPLVVISGEESLHTIKAALDAGALGFIPKSHNSQQMIAALESILDGDIYVPEEIEVQLDSLATRRPPEIADTNATLKAMGITRRQYDVLLLLAKGYSNKQIASSLFLTEHTVKAHVSALFGVMNSRNRTDCVRTAQRLKIIDSEAETP